jgi:hypothetical protein
MTHAARSARPTPVPQVQAGTRSTRGRIRVVLAAFTVALALAGCGSGGGSSTGTSSSSSSSTTTTASTSSAPVAPAVPTASAASVKACLERLGYKDEGALPKAHLTATTPDKAKNFDAVAPLQYHNQGTGFEAHGLPGEGDVYVDVATSAEEAALHVRESRSRYAEVTPEEVREKQKGDFHETHYKIGSVGNVAYLTWSNAAVGVASIKKCAKP